MKKVFATDFDGTLFQYGTVSQQDIDTIRKFRKSGGLFGIATGRMIGSIRREIEKYDIPVDFVIGVNGAVTVDSRFKELDSISIDNKIGLEVKEMLKEGNCIRYSISDGYNVFNVGELPEALQSIIVSRQEILDNNIKGLFGNTETIESARSLCAKINNKYGDYVKALPNYNYIDIASNKTDKAIALENYLKAFKDVTVATAGDAHNDLMMMKKYIGYVMKHGDETIISQIDNQVNTVTEALNDFMDL